MTFWKSEQSKNKSCKTEKNPEQEIYIITDLFNLK